MPRTPVSAAPPATGSRTPMLGGGYRGGRRRGISGHRAGTGTGRAVSGAALLRRVVLTEVK